MGWPPPDGSPSLTLSRVRGVCERLDGGEELWRLSVEQPHCDQAARRAQGGTLRPGGPDDRALRELPIEEGRWLGHDEVGPAQVPAPLQLGERHAGPRVG